MGECVNKTGNQTKLEDLRKIAGFIHCTAIQYYKFMNHSTFFYHFEILMVCLYPGKAVTRWSISLPKCRGCRIRWRIHRSPGITIIQPTLCEHTVHCSLEARVPRNGGAGGGRAAVGVIQRRPTELRWHSDRDTPFVRRGASIIGSEGYKILF